MILDNNKNYCLCCSQNKVTTTTRNVSSSFLLLLLLLLLNNSLTLCESHEELSSSSRSVLTAIISNEDEELEDANNNNFNYHKRLRQWCDENNNKAEDVVVNEKNCHKNNCEDFCDLYGTTFLKDKCCLHVGKSASLLAFEEAELWVPRIEEFNRCTGASIKITYLEEGEDGMADALVRDLGNPDNPDSGEGIYDAYIVQAPWLPAVESSLANLNTRIKENDEYINYQDINPASRDAISWNGTVKALPLDTDYIAIGWREDVFQKHNIPLKPPRTLEELVLLSEKLNGLDHNDDGIPDWGFCLTPQVNYFYSIVAPIYQTSLLNGRRKTGQNLFFDSDTFEPLIFNDGFRLAVELYWRLIRSSNCQSQIPKGEKCSRKTAFPTGRCAGVISMPGTLTKMLKEGEKYSIKARIDEQNNKTVWYPGQNLDSAFYWGRRARMPGSERVIKWDYYNHNNNNNSPKSSRIRQELLPLVDCDESSCPHAEDGINYAPFFSEGGESYALNGKQSKPISRDLMFDLFTWMSELPITKLPMAGHYRKSHIFGDEQKFVLQDAGWPAAMIDDLFSVLKAYFRTEEDGGHPAQDLLLLGFADYMEALDTELHKKFLLGSIEEGGVLNTTNISHSIYPSNDSDAAEFFNTRYDLFINNLANKYNNITDRISGGQLKQLERWRQSLNLVWKSPSELCTDVLVSKNFPAFDRLDCLSAIDIETLCLTQKEYMELYAEGLCGSYLTNLNQIGAYRWVGFLLTFIVISLAIGCAVWTYQQRFNHVIRASQPPFLLFFCLGVVLTSTTMIPLSIDDSHATQRSCDIACMASPWLFFTGFAIIFSAIFSKIWRVNRLLNNASRFKRIKVLAFDVIWPFVFILTMNLCLLLGWTFLDPLVWTRVERDKANSYGICEGGPTSTIFVGLLITVNIGAIILANVQAYQARAVDDMLSESKYFGLAMITMLEMALIGIPMIIILRDNPLAKFAVIIAVISIICISLLLLIFVPKLLLARSALGGRDGGLSSTQSSRNNNNSSSHRSSVVMNNCNHNRRPSCTNTSSTKSMKAPPSMKSNNETYNNNTILPSEKTIMNNNNNPRRNSTSSISSYVINNNRHFNPKKLNPPIDETIWSDPSIELASKQQQLLSDQLSELKELLKEQENVDIDPYLRDTGLSELLHNNKDNESSSEGIFRGI